MIAEPQLEDRAEQHYGSIRAQVAIPELGDGLIPRLLGEVYAWLGEQGLPPAGAPFIRYHVCVPVASMTEKLDIEVGVPVAAAVSGDDRVCAGAFPAGRYATLLYTGDYSGLVEANAALLRWGAENGIIWDSWKAGNGDGFGARLETYLTDPQEEPDPAKWQTEVAIRLADHPDY
jgi:effector-binding domain-containing protein